MVASTSADTMSWCHRRFRGWSVVLTAIVGLSFSTGPLLIYTAGVFAKSLAVEFQCDRARIAGAVSLLDIVGAFAAPTAGRLVDNYGGRPVIVSSIVGLSICLVGLSFVRPPLWHLYVLYIAGGVVGVAATPIGYSRVVANWFDRNRGFSLGLAGTGVGLGAFVTPAITQFCLERQGWRFAYLCLSGLSLAVAAPVVAFFLLDRPRDLAMSEQRSDKASLAPVGRDPHRVRHLPVFWQMSFIFFCVAACCNAVTYHLFPMLTDRGVSGRSAAFATSIVGVAGIVGRAVSGYLVDRFPPGRVAAVIFIGAAGGIALLSTGILEGTIYVTGTLLGLALGAEADLMPFLVSRYFGVSSMAEIFGWLFGAYTLGNATGRYLLARGFDETGSYQTSLFCASIALLLAAIMAGNLRPPDCAHGANRGS